LVQPLRAAAEQDPIHEMHRCAPNAPGRTRFTNLSLALGPFEGGQTDEGSRTVDFPGREFAIWLAVVSMSRKDHSPLPDQIAIVQRMSWRPTPHS